METPKRKIWRTHVQQWQASGLTSIEYGQKHGLKPQALKQWKYELKKSVAKGVIEVKVAASPNVRVKFPKGESVVFSGNVDAVLVSKVLRALRR